MRWWYLRCHRHPARGGVSLCLTIPGLYSMHHHVTSRHRELQARLLCKLASDRWVVLRQHIALVCACTRVDNNRSGAAVFAPALPRVACSTGSAQTRSWAGLASLECMQITMWLHQACYTKLQKHAEGMWKYEGLTRCNFGRLTSHCEPDVPAALWLCSLGSLATWYKSSDIQQKDIHATAVRPAPQAYSTHHTQPSASDALQHRLHVSCLSVSEST